MNFTSNKTNITCINKVRDEKMSASRCRCVCSPSGALRPAAAASASNQEVFSSGHVIAADTAGCLTVRTTLFNCPATVEMFFILSFLVWFDKGV